MNTKHKTRRRAVFAAALVIIGAGVTVSASSAQAVDIITGANATKQCSQGPFAPGQNIPCIATFTNTGNAPATVAALTEQAPWPGGPTTPLSCTIPGIPDPLIISAGSTMPPGSICAVSFLVPIPNDPTLCNTFFSDRVEIDLRYPQPPPQPPLAAGANATNISFVQCLPSITIDKTADGQSKVGDPVNYSIRICNDSLIPVVKTSVIDSLQGDIGALFGAGLAPGACETQGYSRVVQPGDPDTLINTVTAVYSGGVPVSSDTAVDTATTNLFQPGVDVSKDCIPDPIQVGQSELCTIVVENTSSADSPDLENGTISDSLNGDLLDGTNAAIIFSDCGTTLATGASCTIDTQRTVLSTDPDPLVNTVTVHYNPVGFPNDITDEASASVRIVNPRISLDLLATGLSKIGDDVTYTITVCNTGPVDVTRNTVSGNVVGDVTGLAPATLTPGECVSFDVTRPVPAGSPDPLVVTVDATYSGILVSASASASANTNLFQPGVDVTKDCQPDPVTVGTALVCSISVTNTSSADSPALTNGTINDTLAGNLLLAGNPQVTSNTCTGTLAVGASCQITTSRVVLGTDPNPLVNTVSVHYNPTGFPNNIDDSASDSVAVERGGQGCTPGYWKQTQHFDSWVTYLPTTKYSAVFGVVITVNKASGKGTITDPTLLQALQAGGGGINALARHSVASLLNSTNGGVDSNFTTAQVIAIVQDAIAPGGLTIEQAHALFAAANEQGCPLN